MKLVVFAVGLAAFAWFGLTVPLGERTLFQHIANISASKESQDLVRGTKEKVGELLQRDRMKEAPEKAVEAGEKLRGEAQAAREKAPGLEAAKAAPPQERLSAADRDQIRKIIGTAGKK